MFWFPARRPHRQGKPAVSQTVLSDRALTNLITAPRLGDACLRSQRGEVWADALLRGLRLKQRMRAECYLQLHWLLVVNGASSASDVQWPDIQPCRNQTSPYLPRETRTSVLARSLVYRDFTWQSTSFLLLARATIGLGGMQVDSQGRTDGMMAKTQGDDPVSCCGRRNGRRPSELHQARGDMSPPCWRSRQRS